MFLNNKSLDIYEELKSLNAYAKELSSASEAIKLFNTTPELIAKVNAANQGIEIAGFIADSNNKQQLETIHFKPKGQKYYNAIQVTNKKSEALCYPIFFPYGEDGWGNELRKANDNKKITFINYLSSRVLMPEPDLFVLNQNGQLIQTNRFKICERLFQHYLAERYIKMEKYAFQWHKYNQSQILGVNGNPDEVNEEYNNDEREEFKGNEPNKTIDKDREISSNSSPTFLSESFTGGPRHLKKLARNALTIVSDLGSPTVFITATCNKNWPEIKFMLHEGQAPVQRPDVICMVFHQRLNALINNIKHGKYFHGRKQIFFLHVIEYQHRGLPHAHIVCKLENCKENDNDKLKFIENNIFARYVKKNEFENYIDINNKVKQYMLHCCSNRKPNGCKKKNGDCKNGFDKLTPNKTNSFDKRGYPVYYKPNKIDLNIVSYNPEILIDWDGHINVEFCGKTYSVLYLYKYLFKGNL